MQKYGFKLNFATLFSIFMILTNLNLIQFKNFKNLSYPWQDGINFIIGPNGAGKTNILDAIYYSCMTKSFFNSNDGQMILNGKDFFRMEATWQDEVETHFLVVKMAENKLKEVEWDLKKYLKASDHVGKIPVVMVVPDDIFTFIHDSEDRRKFINQTLIQVDHQYLMHLLQYNRLLKQRNASLKLAKSSQHTDYHLLDSYHQGMNLSAKYIYEKRRDFLVQLNPLLDQFSLKISKGLQNSYMEYTSDAAEDLISKWQREYPKDLLLARTHSGIHKDQLIPFFNEKKLKEYGSQGQIKTLLLALRLAQYRYLYKYSGKKPVMLLDDLFAKLDSSRIESLLDVLIEEQIDQCFITDNHPERAKNLASKINSKSNIVYLNDGNLAPYETD
ncbi:MAG: DNA replication and repair protein RecF [Saprospiraceae bacterium]|nr:DNA replication and repair protein RecF [Candidatus Vicinibacter affinis]MBP6173212.1 DNA replication and repair protein RecF [Saprospiraceae bacterium]MBK6823887.1 DNA replication and repair protein RecF [Candidatus Vicinibacter affinis]MBK7305102.1 DNA replication and repair protein RecF [Candidatus Vicinibacter affinis]MBK8642994.1 DNA replication and repair protein RecF [Candidatus Vicinibacter affinis]